LTNLPTNGLPKYLDRLKAIHEPMVRPIVESIMPRIVPYRNPPIKPVTSPGIGEITPEMSKNYKTDKDRGPRS
jgi:hypothetical protein